MAGEDFLLRVAIDANNIPASLLSIANGLASLKGSSTELDVVINKLERDLVKMAGATKTVTAAQSQQAAEGLKLNTQLYNQAQAYDRTAAAAKASAASQAAATRVAQAQIKEALYNQQQNVDRIGQAYNKASPEVARFGNNLATTRYAMFSASQTLSSLGVGLLAVSLLPAIVSTAFQRDFAQVARTVSGAGEDVKQALIGLSQEIPVTFQELSKIAALGGQLGIEKGGILEFTDTVAKLTAVTDLTSEAAGTMLGRFQSLLGLPSNQFDNIASAILNVGVNSSATESQIVAVATGISSISKYAGLTAVQVVGLSGALASLGIQPYAARGNITRIFSDIGAAVSDGGVKLKQFSDLMGISSAQLQKDFGTDKFAGDFVKLAQGLRDTKAAGGDLVSTIKSLGITSSLDRKLLVGLAESTRVLTRDMGNAALGYNNVSIFQNQYAKIAETTSAKVKILGNDFLALFNAVGSGSQTPLNWLVTALSDLVKGFTKLAGSGPGQLILGVAAALGIVAAILALTGALATKGIGGFLGLTTALEGVGVSGGGAAAGLAAINAQMAAAGPVGLALSRVMTGLGLAIKGIAIVGAIIAVVEISKWLENMGNDASGAVLSVSALSRAVDTLSSKDLSKKIVGQFSDKPATGAPKPGSAASKKLPVGNPLAEYTGLLTTLSTPLGSFQADFRNAVGPLAGLTDNLPGGAKGLADLRAQLNNADEALAELVSSGNIGKAKELFSDLMKSQMADGATTKQLTDQLPLYTKAQADAAAATKKTADAVGVTISSMSAFRNETGLSVNEVKGFADTLTKGISAGTAFGDVFSAASKKQQDLAQAAADASGKAGASWQDFPNIAKVGFDQFTAQLEKTINDGISFGNNLQLLAARGALSFAQGLATMGPAGAAIAAEAVGRTDAELAKAEGLAQQRGELAGGGFVAGLVDTLPLIAEANRKGGAAGALAMQQALAAGGPAISETVQKLGIDASKFKAILGVQVETSAADKALQAYITKYNNTHINIRVATTGAGGITKAAGGPIYGPGTGTSDSIPARLSNGEYVIRASSVAKYGTGLFDQLNRGVARFASGGPVGAAPSTTPTPGLSVVALSAQDKAILNWIGNQLSLSIDGKDIAAASGAANLVKIDQRQTA